MAARRNLILVAVLGLGCAAAAIASLSAIRGGRQSQAAQESKAAQRDQPTLVGAPAGERTTAGSVEAPVSSTPGSGASVARIVHGLVIDTKGVPQASIPVTLHALTPDDPRDGTQAQTDSGGRFEIAVGTSGGVLGPGDARFAPVWMGVAKATEANDPVVIVIAPSQSVVGVVLNESDAPIEGAKVEVATPHDLAEGLDLPLVHSIPTSWSLATGKDGRFLIDGAPVTSDTTLAVSAKGYEGAELKMPDGEGPITVHLRAGRPVAGRVTGRVLDAIGSPVADAEVFSGATRAFTDNSGQFQLEPARRTADTEAQQVVAFAKGWLPVRGTPVDGEVVLTLEQRTLSIRGRVLDADGRPVAGAVVRVLDPVTLDEVLATAGVPPRGAEADGVRTLSEQKVSDGDGRFEIAGLLPRPYRVCACDKRTLATAESKPAPAGSEVELRFAANQVARVAGRVVDPRGKPFEAAIVSLRRGNEDSVESDGVSTDADGRFVLSVAGKEDFSILVYPRDMLQPKVFARSIAQDLSSLTLVVGREGRLRVVITTPGLRADTLHVLNGAGEALWLSYRTGGGGRSGDEWDIGDNGEAEPMWVSEEATTLVLYRESVEVSRIPVRITPGELTIARP